MFGPNLCLLLGWVPMGNAPAHISSRVASYRQGCKCERQMNPPSRCLGLTVLAVLPCLPVLLPPSCLPVRSSGIRASLVCGLHDLEAWSHSADAKREIL